MELALEADNFITRYEFLKALNRDYYIAFLLILLATKFRYIPIQSFVRSLIAHEAKSLACVIYGK